jgi:RHS repeat-associated protein
MVSPLVAEPPKRRPRALDSSHAFSTQREDDRESGLKHYRARSYDARPGRFVTKDPVRVPIDISTYAGFATQGRYTYAGLNPNSWTDPLGMYSIDPSCTKGQATVINKAMLQARIDVLVRWDEVSHRVAFSPFGDEEYIQPVLDRDELWAMLREPSDVVMGRPGEKDPLIKCGGLVAPKGGTVYAETSAEDLEITVNTNPDGFFASKLHPDLRAAVLIHEVGHVYWQFRHRNPTKSGARVADFNAAYLRAYGRGLLAPQEPVRNIKDSEGWFLQSVFYPESVEVSEEASFASGKRGAWILEWASGWK